MGQVLVFGLVDGTILALLAVGIVLVYRGSGAINFAQGEIGTFSLFVAWFVSVDHGLPWIVGAALAVLTAVVIGVGFEWFIVRHMLKAERVSVTVATVGLLSLLVSIELQLFSASPRQWPAPIGGLGVRIFGVYVSPTQMIALVLTGALAAGLAVLLKRTDFGLGVQAAAEDPDAARLVGVPLAKVSAFVWGSGAALSAVAALLITPSLGGVFTPNDLRVPFVYALAAAVIGGLHSLPGAFAGGFVMGLFKAATARWIDIDSLPLVDLNATVALLLIVLLVSPDGLAGLARRWRARSAPPAPLAPAEAS
jgi:branched-chain amino acid transport system permease protein